MWGSMALAKRPWERERERERERKVNQKVDREREKQNKIEIAQSKIEKEEKRGEIRDESNRHVCRLKREEEKIIEIDFEKLKVREIQWRKCQANVPSEISQSDAHTISEMDR